jgi:hypothetical protein
MAGRLEGITDQRSTHSYRVVHDPPDTFEIEKILTAGFKFHLHAIKCIWYHKKNFTYYIHKLETPNKSAFLSMNIFTQANSFATP